MSTMLKKNSLIGKQTLIKLSVIVVMFGIGLLPPFGEMTPMGMKLLGVFVGGVYGWIVDGLIWSSILGIVGLASLGLYSDPATAFGQIFGNPTSVLILSACFLCAYVEVLDLSQVIIGWMLNLKACKKNVYVMIYFFFLADLVVAVLSNSLIAIMLFCDFYRRMIKNTSIQKHSITNSFWVCGIAFVAAYSELVVPFKPVAVIIMGFYTANTGEIFSPLLYCACFIPSILIMIFVYLLIGKFILRIDFSEFQAIEVEKVAPTKKQKVALYFLLAFLIVILLPDTLGEIQAFAFLKQMGTATVALAFIAFMMLFRVDNEPVLDIQKLSAKFPWAVFLMISFSMGYSTFLAAEEIGLSATLRTVLTPLLEAVSPLVFVIIIVALAVILTNLLNNMVTLMLFVSALFMMADSLTGININAVFVLLGVASFTACATPAASSTAALAFGQRDLITPKKQFLVGGITVVIFTIFAIVVGYPAFSFFL